MCMSCWRSQARVLDRGDEFTEPRMNDFPESQTAQQFGERDYHGEGEVRSIFDGRGARCTTGCAVRKMQANQAATIL